MRTIRLSAASLVAVCAWSAQFQNGQAARAVIGQPSFSAAAPGISVSSLLASNGRLYATDSAQHTVFFDLSAILTPQEPAKQGSECPVCGFTSMPAAGQASVTPANIAAFGKILVLADTQNHRVLIWRHTDSAAPGGVPDVVMGGSPEDSGTVSATTIEEPVSVAFDGHRLFVGDAALHRILVWNSLPVSRDQPADAVLGQRDFASSASPGLPDAESIGDPVAMASDGANLFVADSAYRRILVFTVGDTPLEDSAITNAASFRAGPVAPGTLIDIDSSHLADVSVAARDDGVHSLPTKLGGVEAVFDGVALPLLSVSPDEVRAQLPYALSGTTAGSLYIRTEHADGTLAVTNAAGVKIAAAGPGLFAFGGGEEPRNGLVVHAGAATGQAGAPVTTENPAVRGQTVVLWATGLGAISSTREAKMGVPFAGPEAQTSVPVRAIVAGRNAHVISAVLPTGSIGVYEIRVLLPENLPADAKTPLLIVQNGYLSNTVTFPMTP